MPLVPIVCRKCYCSIGGTGVPQLMFGYVTENPVDPGPFVFLI